MDPAVETPVVPIVRHHSILCGVCSDQLNAVLVKGCARGSTCCRLFRLTHATGESAVLSQRQMHVVLLLEHCCCCPAALAAAAAAHFTLAVCALYR
jgi:hypothetical protein